MEGSESYRRGESLSLSIFHPDIPRERHPPVPHACELLSRQRPRRLPHPSLRQLRTRFPPRSTRRHSPNPHLGRWIVPADLPIGRNALRIPLARMQLSPRSGFSAEPVSLARSLSLRRLSSYRRSSFSPSPFSELPSSPTLSW